MRKFPAVLALGLLTAGPASAELALTPETAARLALQGNRELRAARAIVAEAAARARTTGRLANPELQAELAGGKDFEGRVELGVAQRFPLTARLRLERRLSEFEIRMATLEVAERERQLTAGARRAFVELASARESVRLAESQARLAGTVSRAVAEEARDGLASTLDAAQSALAGPELASRLASLRAEEAVLTGDFATLLGLPLESAFTLTDARHFPGSVPAGRLPDDRPDLRLAALAVEAGDVDVSLARASRWEDVTVGAFLESERQRDEPEGIEPESLLGIRVSLPLPLWQNGAGRIEEKTAGLARRRLQLEAVRLAVRNEALSAHRAMAARHEAARRLAGDALPAARRFLAETEAAHQRGEIGRAEIFRARERLNALETAALEARRSFHLAHVRWLAAVGPSPTRP